MRITVEISLYPFSEDYVPPIKDFIERLRNHKDLAVVTNATSTQIVGEHSQVFDILSEETAKTFESGQCVFVMKVLSFERDIQRPPKTQ